MRADTLGHVAARTKTGRDTKALGEIIGKSVPLKLVVEADTGCVRRLWEPASQCPARSAGSIESVSQRTLFETLDHAKLLEWVDTRQQEGLHLDFKVIAKAPELTRDDRKNLAKAISGFANSDGGIIVWGVECRKDADEVDAASALVPVNGAPAVLSALNSLTGEAAVPIVSDVEHRLISAADGAAFVVSLVPASDSGPHMAMLGERRYYKRSGDSFYSMEHFDVADMFGRRARPSLNVRLTPGSGGAASSGDGRSAEVQAVVSLENSGRGIARFPLLKLRVTKPYVLSRYELDGNGRSGLAVVTQPPVVSEWRVYGGGVDSVIHPETSLDVTLIKLNIPEAMRKAPDLVVDYVVAAEGMRPLQGQAKVEGADMHRIAMEAIERSFPRTR